VHTPGLSSVFFTFMEVGSPYTYDYFQALM
jgi:hypothetical protein